MPKAPFTNGRTSGAAKGAFADLAGDVNGDGVVDFNDLNEVQSNFGRQS